MTDDSRSPEYWAVLWFVYANADLRLADIIEDDVDFVRHVCFLAQQTVEKYLKGFLVFSERNAPKIHALVPLVKECGFENADFDEWAGILAPLSEYAVSVRYPDGIMVLQRMRPTPSL